VSRLRRIRLSTWLLGIATAIVIAFLLAPIVTVVIFAFNKGANGLQTVGITGLTTKWFGAAWHNSAATGALKTSLTIALCAATLSAIIGTVAGFALARRRGAASRLLEGLVLLLLIVPEIVLAVSLFQFYTKAGVSLGLWPLIFAHTPFPSAVVAIIVRSRVVALDRSLDDAAADLGAGPLRVVRDIQLPLVRPAIMAGALLAFTFSFDDLIISNFLTTPTVTTLPVFLFSTTVRTGVRPDVYAIATMMLAFTLTIVSLGVIVYRWQSRRTGSAVSTVRLLASGQA
jgi:ABC-type spermidine/putrescine transport system permease subunit II